MPQTGDEINRIIRDQSVNSFKIAIRELIDIYNDAWDWYIDQELKSQFTLRTWAKMTKLITKELNILKRVTNDLAIVYKEPARRQAILPGEPDEDGQIRTDKNYDEMISQSPLDVTMMNVNRYTYLTNHSVLKIVFRDGKIDYDLLLFDNVEVIQDKRDWKKILAYKYYIGQKLPFSLDREAVNVSSSGAVPMADRTYKVNRLGQSMTEFRRAFLYTLEDIEEAHQTEDGEQITTVAKRGYIYEIEQVGDEEKIVNVEENPYRDARGNVILPFVLFSKEYPVQSLFNFTAGNDLRDANMNLAVNLAHMNALIKWQSYKTLVLSVSEQTKLPKDMRIDVGSLVVLKGEQERLESIDNQANIKELWDVLMNRLTTALAQHGISPQNFTVSGSPQSGFTLKINNQAKLEAREQQLPVYREGEREIFRISRIIWNHHHQDEPGKKIDEEATLMVDFGEISFPLSPEEQMVEFTFLKQNNAITPVDLIMKRNPDLTREQAEAQFRRNKAFNASESPVVTQPAQQPAGATPEGAEEEEETA